MAGSEDRVEDAKKKAAQRAVSDYFKTDMKFVGIGSGSTVKYVVDAIRETLEKEKPEHSIKFIPTGSQSRQEIETRGLTALPFDQLPNEQVLDVAFDGADEVDDELNCVKGGGACLFQEKLVAMRAKKFVVVADFRKAQRNLLTEWSYIPIEVVPIASTTVIAALKALGSPNPEIRFADSGNSTEPTPVKTDQGFWLVKAPFPQLRMKGEVVGNKAAIGGLAHTKDGLQGQVWEVEPLATAIKSIVGVLEVGLFVGVNGPQAEALRKDTSDLTFGQKPVAAYFGMQDGSVSVRKSEEA